MKERIDEPTNAWMEDKINEGMNKQTNKQTNKRMKE